MKRRVAITGIGLITPLGNSIEENLSFLVSGRSGIGPITRFECSQFSTKIAGEVKNFSPTRWMSKREARSTGRFLQLAIAAGADALDDSGLPARFGDELGERAGCFVGSGFGGLDVLQSSYATFLEKGARFGFSAYSISASLINLAPGHIAIRHNIRGPTLSHVSACASGTHSIGEAAHAIRWGICDVVLAGGTEAAIEALAVGGFNAIKALSTRNDNPKGASRPFERDRDGFVMAEGACILVLEELDHARRRGARSYAEIIGYGTSTDAHHITEPSPEGAGAQRCMERALADAQVNKDQIGYINAHGTSTRFNDIAETHAIKAVFGHYARQLPISSTKSMTGHALGAAGAIEAAFSILSLYHNVLFPTINYDNPDPECDLDYVPNSARDQKVDYVLSNSFGFGGTNASLVFGRIN